LVAIAVIRWRWGSGAGIRDNDVGRRWCWGLGWLRKIGSMKVYQAKIGSRKTDCSKKKQKWYLA
jgi:hypothetical protein